MKTASISSAYSNVKPVHKINMPVLKNPISYEKQIKASDVLPASGLLGGALMAVYMISGGNYNKLMHQVSLKNLAKKSDKIIAGFRNAELLVNKEMKPLKKGYTKVAYSGVKNDREISHIILFDVNGNVKNQLRTFKTMDTVLNIPVGYNKKTQFLHGKDKHVSFIETNYTLDMRPRDSKIIKNGQVKELIYGYDVNGKIAGYAYTDGEKVALKLKNAKEVQKFNSFDDVFNPDLVEDFHRA